MKTIYSRKSNFYKKKNLKRFYFAQAFAVDFGKA